MNRPYRKEILHLIEHKYFIRTVIFLILFNAAILGIETSKDIMAVHGNLLNTIDRVIIGIFVIELALRIYARGWSFFTSWWRWFDFIIIVFSLIPDTQALSVLRPLRILRILRLVSVVPSLRHVVEGLFRAVPGIAAVAVVMSLFFYIFSVIGTHLYGESFPDWFGSLGATMFTLFQIMTLESWSMAIVRPVMDIHPNAWIFFVLYILITTFTMLNLFIAIIVNAMSETSKQEMQQMRDVIHGEVEDVVNQMEKRMDDKLNQHGNKES